MSTDIRISTKLLTHHKFAKLKKHIGDAAAEHLLWLWCYTADNRPHGELTGMDNDDIAHAANYHGDPEKFVRILLSVGWLDQLPSGVHAIHDWADHNPWVYSSEPRSDRARLSRMAMTHRPLYDQLKKQGYTAISKDEYTSIIMASNKPSNDSLTTVERALNDSLTTVERPVNVMQLTPAPAPAPAPAPSPAPIADKTTLRSSPMTGVRLKKPAGGKKASTEAWVNALGNGLRNWFENDWWSAQLRKVKKKECAIAIYDLNPSPDLMDRILSAYIAQRDNDFAHRDPSKVPHPATWIDGACWEDEPLRQASGRALTDWEIELERMEAELAKEKHGKDD